MRPVLGGVTGGLSGPAIRPVAVRCVWQVHPALPDVPVLAWAGSGPASTPEFVLAGAARSGRHRGLRRPRCAGPRPRRARRRPGGPRHRRAGRRRRPRATVRPWSTRGAARRPVRARARRRVAAAGPLCVGIDPQRRCWTRGRWPTPRRAGAVHRHGRRRAGRPVAVVKPQMPSTSGTAPPARRPGGGRRRCRPPARWCCWTPSAATSARPWPPTPTTCVPTTRCVDA